jgi:hypothetical protein
VISCFSVSYSDRSLRLYVTHRHPEHPEQSSVTRKGEGAKMVRRIVSQSKGDYCRFNFLVVAAQGGDWLSSHRSRGIGHSDAAPESGTAGQWGQSQENSEKRKRAAVQGPALRLAGPAWCLKERADPRMTMHRPTYSSRRLTNSGDFGVLEMPQFLVFAMCRLCDAILCSRQTCPVGSCTR